MTAGHYLFGFGGRINRAKWWLLLLIQLGAGIVYYVVMGALFGVAFMSIFQGSVQTAAAGVGGSLFAAALLAIVYSVVMVIIWLAVTTKRLHDRDKSGAWILLFAFVPWVCFAVSFAAMLMQEQEVGGAFSLAGLAICIWAFIELGCLRGTAGDNRYGPDPLNPSYAVAARQP